MKFATRNRSIIKLILKILLICPFVLSAIQAKTQTDERLCRIWTCEKQVKKWDGSTVSIIDELDLTRPDSVTSTAFEIENQKKYGALGKMVWVRRSKFKLLIESALEFEEGNRKVTVNRISEGSYFLVFRYQILPDGSMKAKIKESIGKGLVTFDVHYFSKMEN